MSLVMAEQVAQLALKAIYTRLLGSVPRGHSLRRLITHLAQVLEEARLLRDFVLEHR